MSRNRDLGEFPAAALDIDASGNLDVTGTVTADGVAAGATATTGYDLTIGAFTSLPTVGWNYIDYPSGSGLQIRNGTAPAFAINGGNVGIGNTDPATPLDVRKAGGGNFVANFQNTTAATPYGVSIKDAVGGANGYPLLQVTNSAGTTAHLKVMSCTGDIIVGSGVVFGGAGGTGTSTSNTLDSYEEGTWSPVVVGRTTAGAATYTIQSGTYTKIGNVVHVEGRLGWSAHTGAGTTQINGLPFTNNSHYSNLSIVHRDALTVSASHYVGMSVVPNESHMFVIETSTGTDNAAVIALDVSVTDLAFSGTYTVA